MAGLIDSLGSPWLTDLLGGGHPQGTKYVPPLMSNFEYVHLSANIMQNSYNSIKFEPNVRVPVFVNNQCNLASQISFKTTDLLPQLGVTTLYIVFIRYQHTG